MRSMIISIKSNFGNAPVQSALKIKHKSLSRFVVQTHLAIIVVLDDHSLEVRIFKKRNDCVVRISKTIAQ